MARFRNKVIEICPIGRVLAGELAGEPLVRVVLDNEESFVISPDENRASCWSVDHSFEVHSGKSGVDIIVLYDEMPPQEVKFCGSSEAEERYREAFAYKAP